MTTSGWFDTGTTDIRDDGCPEEKDPDTKEVTQKAVGPWPEDAFVTIKHPAADEDYGLTQKLTWKYYMESSQAQKATMKADFRAELAEPVAFAVLLRGFKGKVFEIDGQIPTIPDDVEDRLKLVRKLPRLVVVRVAKLIDEVNEDPLGLLNPSKSGARGVNSPSTPALHVVEPSEIGSNTSVERLASSSTTQ